MGHRLLSVPKPYAVNYGFVTRRMEPMFAKMGFRFEDVVLMKFRMMLERGSTTEMWDVHGVNTEFPLKTYLPHRDKHLAQQDIVVTYEDHEEQVLKDIEALLRVENGGAPQMIAATYQSIPEAIMAGGKRHLAAVYTRNWKQPLGLKIATRRPEYTRVHSGGIRMRVQPNYDSKKPG